MDEGFVMLDFCFLFLMLIYGKFDLKIVVGELMLKVWNEN